MSDEIIVRIRAEGVDEFTKQVKKAGGVIEDTGKRAETANDKMVKSFNNLGKQIGIAFSVAAAIQFTKVLARTAVDIDATNKKIQKVFGDSTKAVEDFAKKSANSLGLTVNQYKRAAAAVGDLLIPIGFQRKEAAALSNDLVKLSGALAAWTGGQFNATQVSEILTKALLGEREQLKQLGIQISEADVKARLLEKGQEKLTGTAEAQAKALASLELITEKSADAQAAFADDTTTLAEAQLELSAAILEIRDNLAEGLIPVLANVLSAVNDSIKGWRIFFSLFDGRNNIAEVAEQLSRDELQEAIAGLREQQEGLVVNSVKWLGINNKIIPLQNQLNKLNKEARGIRAGQTQAIEEQTEALDDNNKKQKEVNETLFVFVDALNELFTTDNINAIAGDIEQNLTPAIGDLTRALRDAAAAGLSLPDNLDELRTDAERKNSEARIAFAQQERDEKIALALESQELAAQSIGVITNITQDAFNARQIALQNQLREGLISEKEYEQQVSELRRKQAIADKSQAVFQATLNIANAVTKSFGQGGGLLGPGFAAIAIAATAAQLATILATPIPQFAEGTKGSRKAPKGFAWVGEEGPELVQMRGGEKVITAQDSEAIMKVLADYGIPVQFKTSYDELYKPMSAMHKLVKDTPLEGIDWNPLLMSNEVSRRSAGRKLDRIYMEMVRLNNGLTRRMTKA